MSTLQATSGTTAAAAIAETIVGLHVWKIDGFSGTKDLGVGKSIKSSTFNVGGHGWYIECYPCGHDEYSAGCVTLFLCLSVHKEQVEAECCFTLMDIDGDVVHDVGYYKQTYNAETSWGRDWGGVQMERAELESLKGDCLVIRCDVSIVSEFPAVPPPDLHRPLNDIIAHASGMRGDLKTFQVGGELFTVHRGLQGPSTHVPASTTSAAARISAENMAGSHVLTIYGYSNAKKALCPSFRFDSKFFVVGEHKWHIELYPSGEKDQVTYCLAIFLIKIYPHGALKVRFELTLLTLAREVISSTQSCYAFTRTDDICRCYLPFNMATEPLLGDSFHVKCDLTIVNEITPLRPPDLHLHFGDLLANQVGTDVEFEVGAELFSAHKCVLATRSTAFMAEFFGSAGKAGSSTTTVTRVQIEDMEPRVFKALLHFIYTDALPEVHQDDDKVVMAQGLLVAADRYAMERLKLICADMLCNYMDDDARSAFDTLELAVKHGCRRLMEKCMELLKGHFAKVVAP